MYHVILINLAPDARTFVPLGHVEHRAIGAADLTALLRNFCEVDPVENTAADAEIRVQVRSESYLIRTEQTKLILYDAHRRDLPAQIFTVEQVMAELDGSAAALRTKAILAARIEAGMAETAAPVVLPPRPEVVASKPRLIALAVVAALELAAIVILAGPFGGDERPAGFVRVDAAERTALEGRLAGVYLTGNEPGQHGIVVTGSGELKLFELGAVEAPRVVYAAYRLGRIGPLLCLATDQPGGVIEVTDDGSLLYGGEVYLRIP
jgi:hypothetical protein